ncbi:MAG: BON domain-containing protein [Methylotenera sp.]|nr:BON domain-containing protein [Methylotenera sp.]
MKVSAARLILCTTVITMMIAGCNKPQDATALSKSNSALKVEVKDGEVTRRVQVALANDEKLSGFDITVATLKGDVRLTGLVNDQSQIDHAKKIARNTDGVHSIHDELSVNHPGINAGA